MSGQLFSDAVRLTKCIVWQVYEHNSTAFGVGYSHLLILSIHI